MCDKTAEMRIKALADALQDVISLERKVVYKGPLKPGKLGQQEVINYSVRTAREALDAAGIRVRKTGRV